MTKRNLILFSNVLMFLLVSTSSLSAQSDYKITQDFKTTYKNLLGKIDSAKSTDQFISIEKEIIDFKKEYVSHRYLLNDALYPEDFNSVFDKLETKLSESLKSSRKIKGLKREVTQLSEGVERLTDQVRRLLNEVKFLSLTAEKLQKDNAQLRKQIINLKGNPPKDKAENDSLKVLVEKLKENILKRDRLVRNMFDSLLISTSRRLNELTDIERKKFQASLEHFNILDHISKLILDNISFLESTTLTTIDLEKIKNEFLEFESKWKILGPELVEVYSAKEKYKDDLAEINILVYEWSATVDMVAWKSVNKLFENNKLDIEPFTTGYDFFNNVNKFIDKEIRRLEKQREVNQYNTYVHFESVWYNEIVADWMPYLIQSGLFTEVQQKSIESKLDKWKGIVEESTPLWLYLIIVIIVLFFVVGIWNFLVKNKKKSTSKDININIDEKSDSE